MSNSESEGTELDLPSKVLEQVRFNTRKSAKAKSSAAPRGEVQYSSARSDDRDPIAVKQGLADLVSERGWERQSAVGSVTGRWQAIAGKDIAEHVKPESFDESTGTLFLTAESTAWATQIRLLVPSILARLDEEIGQGFVAQINVRGPNSSRNRRS